jgi:hypothetical protein
MLIARGGDGSIEVKQAIEQIEHLLVTNEFSDCRETTRKLRVRPELVI